MADMPSLKATLAEHGVTEEHPVYAALVAREERQAEGLRMAGANFGLHAEIVSEALAEIGLGEIDPTARAFIRAQFVAFMARLAQQMREGGEQS